MLLGDPYRFAFLIERIPEWEKTGWKNGIMFVIINDDVYPKYVPTTTFNSEMPDILRADSAFITPIIDTELYLKSDEEIIEIVDDEENEKYYFYFIPFHEINDSGYRIYVISNSFNVKLIVCKWETKIEKMVFVDKLEISVEEYDMIKKQIIDCYDDYNL